MKHRHLLLAALTLSLGTLSLSACGSSDSSGSSGSDEDAYKVVTLVSAKDAGGTSASALTWLQDDSSANEYAAQFKGPLKARLTAAFADAKVPAGDNLFASIVSVGCGAPTSAVVFSSMSGMEVNPSPSPAPDGCAEKTTTVAVVVGPPPQ